MNKRCEVTIDNLGKSFTCEDVCVLDAAITQSIEVPYNCRGGACGTCKAQILEGAVEHGWVMGFAISDEEIAAGRCLLCSSRPTTERLVVRMLTESVPRASVSTPPAEYLTEVVAANAVAKSVRQITLALPEQAAFSFDAGMYVETMLDGVHPPRPYSILTTPDLEGRARDGMLTILVTRHPNGESSGRLHDTVRVGDTLRIRGPYGTFRLPDSPAGPILMLAGGTGVAPLLSMARLLLARGYEQAITLLFSVRRAEEIFLLEELQRLSRRHANFESQLFLTREDSAVPAHWRRCRISAHLAATSALERYQHVMIAGSPGFVADCREGAMRAGFSASALLTEAYENRRVIAAP